jgi:hypothetical protein
VLFNFLHDCLGLIDLALLTKFLCSFNVEVDLLLELINPLVGGFLLESTHFRHVQLRVITSTSSGDLNTRQTALDFLIDLRNHLLKQRLQLLLVFPLILISSGVILKHVLEELIMTFLASRYNILVQTCKNITGPNLP